MNHRVLEWFRMEGNLKIISCHPPEGDSVGNVGEMCRGGERWVRLRVLLGFC